MSAVAAAAADVKANTPYVAGAVVIILCVTVEANSVLAASVYPLCD